jgi:hypothetical protein
VTDDVTESPDEVVLDDVLLTALLHDLPGVDVVNQFQNLFTNNT